MPVPEQAAVAAAVRARLAADPFACSLGIELVDLAPGYARLTMTVTQTMLNFAGVAHGGAIFALADAAHAAAGNSHGKLAMALDLQIHYLAPGRPGQRLVAEAREEHLGERSALYHITVADRDTGDLLASCLGRVFRRDIPVAPGDGAGHGRS